MKSGPPWRGFAAVPAAAAARLARSAAPTTPRPPPQRRGVCSGDSETERDENHGENLGKTWENAGKTL